MPNIVEKSFLKEPLRQRESTKNEFRYINVSGLTKLKGVENLIRAFGNAFKGNDLISLDIVGEGREKSRLNALVRQLGIEDQVHFLGGLSRGQVLKAISKTDILVLSSRHETFGVVVIEALALGKPVIATRCGGPESFVTQEDGLLVPFGDIKAMAEAMKIIREEINCYDPVKIRESCRRRFSEQAVITRMSGIYSEILNT
jgi:glycosyltransferase involved in cell wall biosynthesis